MAKRYYWFKMKRDFFEDPKVRKLLLRGNVGEHAVILYERLLLLAIRNEGHVALDDESPVEDLCYLLGDQMERLSPALDLLVKVGLTSMEKEGLYLPEAKNNVGSEDESAERKRRQRKREREKKQAESKGRDIVTAEKEKEKEKEIDTDLHSDTESSADAAAMTTLPLRDGKEFSISFQDAQGYRALYPELDVERELRHMKSWLLNNPKKRRKAEDMGRFVAGWLNRVSNERGRGSGIDDQRSEVADRGNGNRRSVSTDGNPDASGSAFVGYGANPHFSISPERKAALEEAVRLTERAVPKLKPKKAS